jgi:eukaryotic-like serine/threonine-protein kinase
MHPREFGKYRIVKLLPLGGMGRVYLAIDTETNRQIALKLIDHGPDPDRQEIVDAERRGAILQARLCGIDNRITRILGYGDLDGYFFIEMEYIEGQDLSELLAKAPLGALFAARIGRDICDVLAEAHTFSANIDDHEYQGIVHGDIKPRNIRITPDGQVRVLDFGIAKALSLTRRFTTNQFGSSQYSSPERLNTGEVDVASDLWSVGVVLFEIVTGKPYFEGAPSAKVEHAIRNYAAVRPLPESLPAPFAAIIRKAVAVNPADRYPSAAAFAADLSAFLEGKPTVAESMPPAEDDAEATRRTVHATTPELDEDATRRTGVPLGQSSPGATAPTLQRPVRFTAKQKKPLTKLQRQIRFFTAIGVLIAIGVLAFNEITVWRAGASLAREVESERLTDMNVAWERFETLSRTNVLPFVLAHPRNTIRARLVSTADGIIREYRNSDLPTITENDWVKAHEVLSKALQLDPGNTEMRGKLYLAEAHLARIRGTSRGNSKLLQEARTRFEQSADLMPRAPDPYLGLARLYVYSIRDVERAEDALKAADKRGHEMGRRERAQLADGYRERGERLMRDAARAAGLPEEKDLLKRAQEDLERAEDTYRDILPYGSSSTSLRRVLENLDVIAARRDAMKDSIWPWR